MLGLETLLAIINHAEQLHMLGSRDGDPGGRLQLVLMRHPPQLFVKTWGGGVGAGGGGVGGRGGDWQLGRGGGCAQPTTITCIPQGGVWGHGSIEVCMR